MLHSVSGMIVGGEVNQERVLFKFRRAPHRNFRTHDPLYVFHECSASAAFRTKRMDHDIILFAISLEVVLSPIRTDLVGRVDHDVPVWKLPFSLTVPFRAAVHDSPAGGRMDREVNKVRLVADDIQLD